MKSNLLLISMLLMITDVAAMDKYQVNNNVSHRSVLGWLGNKASGAMGSIVSALTKVKASVPSLRAIKANVCKIPTFFNKKISALVIAVPLALIGSYLLYNLKNAQDPDEEIPLKRKIRVETL